jgi:hypothetical protein
MQPPQGPGPYGGPPFPGPPGYAPAARSRRGPLIIVVVVVVLVVAGIGLGALLYGSRTEGAYRTPAACSLLSQAQVAAYVPGAVPGEDGDAYYCPWGRPVGAKDEPGRLTVAVETLPGERPLVKDAKEEYGVRRRQADEPGTTITPLSVGDESFMACAAPSRGAPGSCKTYTRVSNVVFSLQFESFPVANAREPASSVRALTTQAVRHLRGLAG